MSYQVFRITCTFIRSHACTCTYLCMPDNPQYSTYVYTWSATLKFGVKYHYSTGTPISPNRAHHSVPCAVCHVRARGSLLMIPARQERPTSWTEEYEGVLMCEYRLNHRTLFECVDREAESVPGSATGASYFYPVEASCTGMACPLYDDQKELLCVV